jgi:hypothetical protein
MGANLREHHAAEGMTDEHDGRSAFVEQRPNMVGIVDFRVGETARELYGNIRDSEIVQVRDHTAPGRRRAADAMNEHHGR